MESLQHKRCKEFYKIGEEENIELEYDGEFVRLIPFSLAPEFSSRFNADELGKRKETEQKKTEKSYCNVNAWRFLEKDFTPACLYCIKHVRLANDSNYFM